MDPSHMAPLRWSFGTMSTFSAPLVKTNSWYAEIKTLLRFSLSFLSGKICIHRFETLSTMVYWNEKSMCFCHHFYLNYIFTFWEWQMKSSIIAKKFWRRCCDSFQRRRFEMIEDLGGCFHHFSHLLACLQGDGEEIFFIWLITERKIFFRWLKKYDQII